MLEDLQWPVPVWVALITTVGSILIAFLGGRKSGKHSVEGEISESMRLLLEEYRAGHKRDRERIEELTSRIFDLEASIRRLTQHVATLEGQIASLGGEAPPRPDMREALNADPAASR